MEKRVIVAMVLSFAVIFVIQMIQVRRVEEHRKRYPVTTPTPVREAEVTQATPAPSPGRGEADAPAVSDATDSEEARRPQTLAEALESAGSATAERTITFECDKWQVVFTTRGGAFQSIRLLEHEEMEGEIRYWKKKTESAQGEDRKFLEQKVAHMESRRAEIQRLETELERVRGTSREQEVARQLRAERAVELIGESKIAPTLHIGELRVDDALVYACNASGGRVNSPQEVAFVGELAGLTITKTYRLDSETHRIDFTLSVKKGPGAPVDYPGERDYSVWWEPRTTQDFKLSRGKRATMYEVAGKTYPGEKFQQRIRKQEMLADQGVNWAVSQGDYFLVALIPEEVAFPVKMSQHSHSVALKARDSALDPGGHPLEAQFHIYAGPKTLEGLQSQGVGLENIAYGGWTGGLSRAVLSVLRLFTRFTKNYGVSIILITVLLRVLTHPLNKKQMESTEKMKALQPQMKNLQEKYKNDPQRLQKETWKLYKTHKVNPLGGCLPLLLIMPIFIALYTCFGNAIELRGASFLWIKDLSAADTIFYIFLPFPLPFIGSIIPVNVLPILYGALSIWQQSRMPMDPKQANMMRFLPLFFVVLFYNFASGVILYFFFSNLLMVVGQILHEKHKKQPATVEVKK
jgi:YidC/Oxa1 family membrane protein insertase